MKIFAFGVLFLMIGVDSIGQANKAVLTKDIIFDRDALKNLRFTNEAQRLGKSVRVFVGFTINKQGAYHNVSVLNDGLVDEPFKQAIDRFWSNLPKQDPTYAGSYVVPIVFLLGEGGPKELKQISNESDKAVNYNNYKLLNEVSVIGYILCEKRSMIE